MNVETPIADERPPTFAEGLLTQGLRGCPRGFRVQLGSTRFLEVCAFLELEGAARRNRIELGEEFNGAVIERIRWAPPLYVGGVNP